MGIITKEVQVKPRGKTIQYYKDKGYDAKYNQYLTVNVEDLPSESHIIIEAKCDICGEIRKIKYRDYNKIILNGGYYCCNKCFYNKVIVTNRTKYGCDNVMQDKDIYLKQSKSLEQKYGVSTPLKNNEIKNKVESTMMKKFGAKCSFMSKDLQAKIRESLVKKYGVEFPTKSPEVRKRVANTLYKNSTTPTSRQQLYIYNLYYINNDNRPYLNYPISYYNADICFPDEKLNIEVDFGGHNLVVKLGQLTQEEFNRKEIIRNNVIKKEGYKQMRIISENDKLPSDQILLQMLQDARNYFSEYPNHSWIEFNISTSSIRNAENKNGTPYDFGTLRKIKDEDLTNIEQQNQSNNKKGA